MSNPAPRVAILMGSDSDLPVMTETVKVLRRLEVPFRLDVTSAHRSPERTAEIIRSSEASGVQVFIAGLVVKCSGINVVTFC